MKLVISDAHEGLKAAAAKVLAATWQRCKVHHLRNALAHAGKGQRQMVLAAINTAFAQESFETASHQWRLVADQLRDKFPKLAELMDGAEADVLAFMTFPKAHRTQIHSTRWSGSTPRSSGAPTSWASSRTKRRSRGSSAHYCSSRTTSGNCSGATCHLRRCGP